MDLPLAGSLAFRFQLKSLYFKKTFLDLPSKISYPLYCIYYVGLFSLEFFNQGIQFAPPISIFMTILCRKTAIIMMTKCLGLPAQS